MKPITELTEQEILALTDQELETMVKLRMAEDGIKILSKPDEPEYLPLPEKTEVAYGIGGFSYKFTNEEAARKVGDLIYSFKDEIKNDSYIGGDYSHKVLKNMDTYSAESFGTVTRSDYYSAQAASEISNILALNKKTKETYDAKLLEYGQAEESSQIIKDEIYGRYDQVASKYRDFERMRERYAEYLTLANGAGDIALAFLKKAYSVDEECAAFVTAPETIES